MTSENNIRRFIRFTDETGKSRVIRTEEEKVRRREETQSLKVYKKKKCSWCKNSYTPYFQYGTKRWKSNRYCSVKCRNAAANANPVYRQRKNASRRGNSELHRRAYLRRIELHGGTRWQLGDETFREKARQRNRKRYKRLYGKQNQYTLERRSNSQHHRVRRKKEMHKSALTSIEVSQCIEIRIQAKRLALKHNIELHVDHLLPLRRGGREHPDNLLIMRKEANLFWGARIKKCPWPRKKNWLEPVWEVDLNEKEQA